MSAAAPSQPVVDQQPTAPAAREEALDGLRGLALLGILLVNTLYFMGFYLPSVETPTNMASDVTVWIVAVLVQQKALGLFALLFGIGVALQLPKLERGSISWTIMLRRYGLLFAFGIAHGILLWGGDILRYLAITGIALLAISRLSRQFVRAAAVICLTLPILAGALVASLPESGQDAQESESAAAVLPDLGVTTQATETDEQVPTNKAPAQFRSYTGLVTSRAREIWPSPGVVTGPGGVYYILGMAMLGLIAARSGWHTRPDGTPWRARHWLLALGLLGGLLYAWARLAEGPVIALLAGAYMGAALAILYAMWWLRSWHRPDGPGWMRILAPAGRMALTNYLLQSVVMTTLMYDYGVGLMGRITPLEGVLIALLLYVLQVAFSLLWFRQFRFGPMEWFWRSLTYGKAQPMRVRRAAPAQAPRP